MKENYKAGDKVTVIKPGIFDNLTGEVLTNHPGTDFKPLSIDLGPFGIWQFEYNDVQLTKPEKEPVEKFPFDEKPKASKLKVKKPVKKQPTKRAYTKKPKQ